MDNRTLILIGIGLMFSLIKVMRNPSKYINGLFKSVTDKEKTDALNFLVVLFVAIAAPLYFLFDVPLKSLDAIAVGMMSITAIWKGIEVFKNPKLYFRGLSKNVDEDKKTTYEPIGLFVISIVVLFSYLIKQILINTI